MRNGLCHSRITWCLSQILFWVFFFFFFSLDIPAASLVANTEWEFLHFLSIGQWCRLGGVDFFLQAFCPLQFTHSMSQTFTVLNQHHGWLQILNKLCEMGKKIYQEKNFCDKFHLSDKLHNWFSLNKYVKNPFIWMYCFTDSNTKKIN